MYPDMVALTECFHSTHRARIINALGRTNGECRFTILSGGQAHLLLQAIMVELSATWTFSDLSAIGQGTTLPVLKATVGNAMRRPRCGKSDAAVLVGLGGHAYSLVNDLATVFLDSGMSSSAVQVFILVDDVYEQSAAQLAYRLGGHAERLHISIRFPGPLLGHMLATRVLEDANVGFLMFFRSLVDRTQPGVYRSLLQRVCKTLEAACTRWPAGQQMIARRSSEAHNVLNQNSTQWEAVAAWLELRKDLVQDCWLETAPAYPWWERMRTLALDYHTLCRMAMRHERTRLCAMGECLKVKVQYGPCRDYALVGAIESLYVNLHLPPVGERVDVPYGEAARLRAAVMRQEPDLIQSAKDTDCLLESLLRSRHLDRGSGCSTKGDTFDMFAAPSDVSMLSLNDEKWRCMEKTRATLATLLYVKPRSKLSTPRSTFMPRLSFESRKMPLSAKGSRRQKRWNLEMPFVLRSQCAIAQLKVHAAASAHLKPSRLMTDDAVSGAFDEVAGFLSPLAEPQIRSRRAAELKRRLLKTHLRTIASQGELKAAVAQVKSVLLVS